MYLRCIYLIPHAFQHWDVEIKHIVYVLLTEDAAQVACADAGYDCTIKIFPQSLIQLPVAQITMAEYYKRISLVAVIVLRFAEVEGIKFVPNFSLNTCEYTPEIGLSSPRRL